MSWYLYHKNKSTDSNTPKATPLKLEKNNTKNIIKDIIKDNTETNTEIVCDIQEFQIENSLITIKSGIVNIQKNLNIDNKEIYIEQNLPFSKITIENS